MELPLNVEITASYYTESGQNILKHIKLILVNDYWLQLHRKWFFLNYVNGKCTGNWECVGHPRRCKWHRVSNFPVEKNHILKRQCFHIRAIKITSNSLIPTSSTVTNEINTERNISDHSDTISSHQLLFRNAQFIQTNSD